jgi:hypothetical protein
MVGVGGAVVIMRLYLSYRAGSALPVPLGKVSAGPARMEHA